MQRKIGPGQYVGSGASDPVFIIGDLSTVWVVAFVRETEAPTVHIGQAIYFTVLAYPDRAFPANISYVAAALDPTTRRLMVRATVNNVGRAAQARNVRQCEDLHRRRRHRGRRLPRDAVIYEGEQCPGLGGRAMTAKRSSCGGSRSG